MTLNGLWPVEMVSKGNGLGFNDARLRPPTCPRQRDHDGAAVSPGSGPRP
jgi:hypothetical protein